jgi:hypothetical protein
MMCVVVCCGVFTEREKTERHAFKKKARRRKVTTYDLSELRHHILWFRTRQQEQIHHTTLTNPMRGVGLAILIVDNVDEGLGWIEPKHPTSSRF